MSKTRNWLLVSLLFITSYAVFAMEQNFLVIGTADQSLFLTQNHSSLVQLLSHRNTFAKLLIETTKKISELKGKPKQEVSKALPSIVGSYNDMRKDTVEYIESLRLNHEEKLTESQKLKLNKLFYG